MSFHQWSLLEETSTLGSVIGWIMFVMGIIPGLAARLFGLRIYMYYDYV